MSMMGKRKKVWSKEYIEKIVDGEEDVEEEFVSPKKCYRKVPNTKAYFDKNTWSIPEKALLLEGLKQFGFNNLDKVADHVKTKTINEVRQHLKNRRSLLIRKHNKEKKDYDKQKKRTVIQSWYEIASSEVPSRHKRDDISWIFSEMFSNAAKNEPHLKPRTDSDPDIAAIYQYFADMLSGVFPADLRPVDSTVVLSLLHTLGNIISKGNFNLEKEMYSKFRGTKGNGSLLSSLSFNSNTNKDDNSNKDNSNEIKTKESTVKHNISKVFNDDTIEILGTTNKVDKDSNSFDQVDDANAKDKVDSNSITKQDDKNEIDKDDSDSVVYSNVENDDHEQNSSIINEDSDTDAVIHNTSDAIVASENENDGTNKITCIDSSSMNEDNDSNIVQMQIECNPDSIDSNQSEFKDDDLNDDSSDLWKKFQLNDPLNVRLAKKFRRVIQLLNPLHVPPYLMQIEHDILKQFQ